MRLKISKDVDKEKVVADTGLPDEVVDWVLAGNEAHPTVLELISSSTGLKIISSPWEEEENVIEFSKGSKVATATLNKGRLATRLLKINKERPDDCRVISESNGILCIQFPASWIKINPTRILTDDERDRLSQRMKNVKNCLEI